MTSSRDARSARGDPPRPSLFAPLFLFYPSPLADRPRPVRRAPSDASDARSDPFDPSLTYSFDLFTLQMAGKTAAMIAASNGNTEILKALGRGPSLLDLKDADGGTAAMTAAVHHHGSVLDYVSSCPSSNIVRLSRSAPP